MENQSNSELSYTIPPNRRHRRKRDDYTSSLPGGSPYLENSPHHTHSDGTHMPNDSNFFLGEVHTEDYVDPYAEDDDDDDDEKKEEEYISERVKGKSSKNTTKNERVRQMLRNMTPEQRIKYFVERREEHSRHKSSTQKRNYKSSNQKGSKKKHDRSYYSLSLAWSDDLHDDSFAELTEKEIENMENRDVFLELETYLMCTHAQLTVEQSDDILSVGKVVSYMKTKGYKFIQEHGNSRGADKKYVYYRLDDDGSVVLVGNANTFQYIGRFYTPIVSDVVARLMKRKQRTKQ